MVGAGLKPALSCTTRIQPPITTRHFKEFGLLGGITDRSVSKDFRGGRLTAFLGGVSVDLREAEIVEKPVRIYVSAILGGVEISVPQHWNVKKDVQPIAGGVDDRRPLVRHHDDDDESPDNAPDLVVTGSVLLGGLLIRD